MAVMAYSTPLTGISSMATRSVLSELTLTYFEEMCDSISIASVGGVEALRRVQSGEHFAVIFLASNAIDSLIVSGHAIDGSRVDLMRSDVSVAVPAGTRWPDISTEEALRVAVLQAPKIGFSTGPSGMALLKLFERWGLTSVLRDRLIQAPVGVPVGQLLATGQVALGFQQTSELLQMSQINILGPMPQGASISTTFSAAIGATCRDLYRAQKLLNFLASSQTAAVKYRYGMHSINPKN